MSTVSTSFQETPKTKAMCGCTDRTHDELRRIADVADKYSIPMVKVTGGQRIDLLGVKKEDLVPVWNPDTARALVRTMLEACRWVDSPSHRDEIAPWLAKADALARHR